jgi:hypothetical protein
LGAEKNTGKKGVIKMPTFNKGISQELALVISVFGSIVVFALVGMIIG